MEHNNNSRRKIDMSIWPTVLMIFILCVLFFAGTPMINRIVREACFETLADTTAGFVGDIRRNMQNEKKQLEVIADILSEYEDISSVKAREHMSSIQQRGMISSLTVLLPENHSIFFKDGNYKEVESILDFEKEKAKGAYVSGVLRSAIEEDENYIYQAVPVEADGEVKGILYGFTNLDSMPREYSVKAYGGNAQLYILDAATGDFIMDTWHDELPNLYDGSMGVRTTKAGYNPTEWEEELRMGKESHVVFYSHTTGDYFYTYAMPVGINEWVAQVSAPESIVFARAERIRYILYVLAAFISCALALYFVWVLSKVKQMSRQRGRRLQQTLYMYDVQRVLFDAHKSPERMTEALQKAADMLGASVTFLCSLDGTQVENFYRFANGEDSRKLVKESTVREMLEIVGGRLFAGQNILLDSRDKRAAVEEMERAKLRIYGIHSLMLVPVQSMEGKTIGVLGAVNTQCFHKDARLLECIAWNFMMALNNRKSYKLIQQMGTVDAITGLKNRNSYEQKLKELEGKTDKSLCCIYIDVNGLHELNNTKGHAAGDEMLYCVGNRLQGQFGSESTYRIGGDEFVVFCKRLSEEAVREKLDQVEAVLLEKDYHISIGTSWNTETTEMEKMVGLAEQRMYEQKRIYYEKMGKSVRNR